MRTMSVLCQTWENSMTQRQFSKNQNQISTRQKYALSWTLLLAMIALSTVQSSAGTLIHNAILSSDTSTMPDTIMLIRYSGRHILAIIANNSRSKFGD